MRRREVLKIAAGCAAWPGLPAIAATAAPALTAFVADRRFAGACAAATPPGARRHEIDGDVTALWYDHLDRDWRAPGGLLVGLTGSDALFVLEHLAWDRRRHVVVREQLAHAAGGVPLVRWIIAPRTAVA